MIFSFRLAQRAAIMALSFASLGLAQKDPGVRGGLPGGGGPVAGLTLNELALFNEGKKRTTQLESVCDNCSDVTLGADTGQDPNLATLTNSSGLGARYNGDQCSVCHQQPAIGGSGGFLVPNPQDSPSHYRKPENPMFDLIPHRKGGQNYVPSFITQYGPIREVRFQRNPDGTPDGGVHALFTIVGRSDIGASGCTAANLPPTDFETQYRKGNLSFRMPLQLFGLGLIESIQDRTILNNSASTASLRARLGIGGIPNRSGNDGTITRFGWKAQNKSLVIFAGEAYNVEMGVTNDVFPTARDRRRACNTSRKRAKLFSAHRLERGAHRGLQPPAAKPGGGEEFVFLHRPFGAAATGAFFRQRSARPATVRYWGGQSGSRLLPLPFAHDGDRSPPRDRGAPESTGESLFRPADPSHG